MPEGAVQDAATQCAVSWLSGGLRRRGRNVAVRRNPALRWDEAHPKVGVDPDVCVLEPPPDLPPGELTSLCTWREGVSPPIIALEIVSERTAAKDYDEGPRKYAASGTRELWVFDPQRFGPDDDGGPWVLQLWERGRNDQFRRIYVGNGPVRSEALGAWLRVSADGLTLRASDDEDGALLWPTEREEAEAANAARATAVAALDSERRAREAAEARVAALEALLAKG